MFARRRILALAGVAVVIGVLAGSANAAPKNQLPSTRAVDSLFAQSVNRAVDVAPKPEAKNELPFTRFVGAVVTTSDHHGASAPTLWGGGAGGFDWPLMAWIGVAATTLLGGALVFRRGATLSGRQWSNHLTKGRLGGAIAALVVVAAVTAAGSQAQTQRGRTAAAIAPAAYARDVSQICASAVLFEGSYALGSRQGTLDAAADIHASTQRRLSEVAQLPMPQFEEQTIEKWVAVQQRLADTYAKNLIQLYDLIATLSTPEQAARAPKLIRAVLDASYPLRLVAGRLELRLGVPDCTGD